MVYATALSYAAFDPWQMSFPPLVDGVDPDWIEKANDAMGSSRGSLAPRYVNIARTLAAMTADPLVAAGILSCARRAWPDVPEPPVGATDAAPADAEFIVDAGEALNEACVEEHPAAGGPIPPGMRFGGDLLQPPDWRSATEVHAFVRYRALMRTDADPVGRAVLLEVTVRQLLLRFALGFGRGAQFTAGRALTTIAASIDTPGEIRSFWRKVAAQLEGEPDARVPGRLSDAVDAHTEKLARRIVRELGHDSDKLTVAERAARYRARRTDRVEPDDESRPVRH